VTKNYASTVFKNELMQKYVCGGEHYVIDEGLSWLFMKLGYSFAVSRWQSTVLKLK
jgi:hypothetical protein